MSKQEKQPKPLAQAHGSAGRVHVCEDDDFEEGRCFICGAIKFLGKPSSRDSAIAAAETLAPAGEAGQPGMFPKQISGTSKQPNDQAEARRTKPTT